MHCESKRYVVGKTYPFIEKDLYVDTEYRIIMCECVSEHLVPIRESSSTTTGYVFKDAQDNVWNNQYPVADYGQVDTSSDYKLHRMTPGLCVLHDLSHLLCTLRNDAKIFGNARAKQLYESLLNEDIPGMGYYKAYPFIVPTTDKSPIMIIGDVISHRSESDVSQEDHEVYVTCAEISKLLEECRPTKTPTTREELIGIANTVHQKFQDTGVTVDRIEDHGLLGSSITLTVHIRFDKHEKQYVFFSVLRPKV